MSSSRALVALAVILAPHLASAAPGASPAAPAAAPRWIGTWGASPQDTDEPLAIKNATIRQIARVSLGGHRVRLRLSNAYGSAPLVVDATHVALRAKAAALVAGSDRTATFAGKPRATIPAGGIVLSDPIALDVADRAELAISLYFAGAPKLATEHSLAFATTYVSGPGDQSARDFTPASTTEATYVVTDVEVERTDAAARAVVVLGDSLTDGDGITIDTAHRWTDVLADRLLAARAPVGVINEGIAGNRLLHDFLATNAIARLDRDALAKAGVRYLFLVEGLNDFGIPGAFARPTETVTADDVIAAYQQIIARAHAVGLTVYGATLLPYEGTKRAGYYTAAGDRARQTINQWLRTSRAFDAVVDFEAAVRDPAHPTRLRAQFDSGDHIHPNDAGYAAMANAIDLALFR